MRRKCACVAAEHYPNSTHSGVAAVTASAQFENEAHSHAMSTYRWSIAPLQSVESPVTSQCVQITHGFVSRQAKARGAKVSTSLAAAADVTQQLTRLPSACTPSTALPSTDSLIFNHDRNAGHGTSGAGSASPADSPKLTQSVSVGCHTRVPRPGAISTHHQHNAPASGDTAAVEGRLLLECPCLPA